jgi:DNA repair exonuclease SbcCD ATPase subunit
LKRIGEGISAIHKAILQMRNVKKQVEHYNELLKDKKENKELVEAGNALIKKINEWEANLIETRQRNFQDVINWPSKLNAEFFNLKGLADVHDPRITNGLKVRLADLEAEWNKYKAQMEGDLIKAVDAYNQKFKGANFPAVIQ